MVVTGGLGYQDDGVSDMELDFTSDTHTTWARCTSNSLGREACIGAVAIHEFGPSLGFAHEQRRPDTPSSCTNGLTRGSRGDTLVGDWDGQSIMNYCSSSTFPSAGDVSGAIETYGISGRYVAAIAVI